MGVTELLTMAETAALLKTTKQQVRKMISQQLIPAMKIGREWRISRQYLEDFLRNNMIFCQRHSLSTFSAILRLTTTKEGVSCKKHCW